MSAILLRLGTRAALCAVACWLVWRSQGLTAMLVVAPVFGIALARPLLDLASESRHALRAGLWRDVEGRHYAFRGVALQVIEDESHRRWVRTADVRRIVGPTASDGALALSYPHGWRLLGRRLQPHLSATALLAHLRKQTSPEAVRFHRWVEREIEFPARRLQERFGIRVG